MKHPCQDHRDLWLEQALDPAPGSQESHGCPQCAEWEALQRAQVNLLRSLSPLHLPETQAIQESDLLPMGEGSGELHVTLIGPIERVLGELSTPQAPRELDERVEDELRLAGTLDPASGPLGCLENHVSPSVLDRLVEEELASPLGHLSARLIGRMERCKAPVELAARVAQDLIPSRPGFLSGRSGGWISFLAACLVGWLAIQVFTPAERAPGRRLTIVRAISLAELSPIARSHMEALGAGPSTALQLPTGGQH